MIYLGIMGKNQVYLCINNVVFFDYFSCVTANALYFVVGKYLVKNLGKIKFLVDFFSRLKFKSMGNKILFDLVEYNWISI